MKKIVIISLFLIISQQVHSARLTVANNLDEDIWLDYKTENPTDPRSPSLQSWYHGDPVKIQAHDWKTVDHGIWNIKNVQFLDKNLMGVADIGKARIRGNTRKPDGTFDYYSTGEIYNKVFSHVGPSANWTLNIEKP